jgi:hypothetical protein
MRQLPRDRTRAVLGSAPALTLALIAACAPAGFSVDTSSDAGRTPAITSPSESTTEGKSMTKIRFRIGGAEATATLRDNETARDFASLLPLTLEMHDLLGREKPGQLPRPLAEGGEHQFGYEVGDVAYWPPNHDVAIFYADDGKRTIPSPGIVPLATIDSGLDVIASAGGDFQMTIEPLN